MVEHVNFGGGGGGGGGGGWELYDACALHIILHYCLRGCIILFCVKLHGAYINIL